MTTGVFRHLDPAAVDPWAKVDADVTSFRRVERKRSVSNIRHHLRHPGDDDDDGFGSDVDVAGFAVYHAPSQTQTTDPAVFFAPDDSDVRDKYYPEVEQLLRDKLGPKVRKVAIFDHTVRHHDPAAPRQPVQQVHVDQTPKAAEARVRRHLPPDEADDLLKTRHQLINVWRPIGHPASDLPLAVIDWRTTAPEDLVKVDLLYPVENRDTGHGDDDRGKERLPDPEKAMDVSNYEARGKQPSDHPSISKYLLEYIYKTDMQVCLLDRRDLFGPTLGQAQILLHERHDPRRGNVHQVF